MAAVLKPVHSCISVRVLMVAPSVRVPDTLGQTLHQLALADGLARRGIGVTLICRYDSNNIDTSNFSPNLKFMPIVDLGIPFERIIFTSISYQKVLTELKTGEYDLVLSLIHI